MFVFARKALILHPEIENQQHLYKVIAGGGLHCLKLLHLAKEGLLQLIQCMIRKHLLLQTHMGQLTPVTHLVCQQSLQHVPSWALAHIP